VSRRGGRNRGCRCRLRRRWRLRCRSSLLLGKIDGRKLGGNRNRCGCGSGFRRCRLRLTPQHVHQRSTGCRSRSIPASTRSCFGRLNTQGDGVAFRVQGVGMRLVQINDQARHRRVGTVQTDAHTADTVGIQRKMFLLRVGKSTG